MILAFQLWYLCSYQSILCNTSKFFDSLKNKFVLTLNQGLLRRASSMISLHAEVWMVGTKSNFRSSVSTRYTPCSACFILEWAAIYNREHFSRKKSLLISWVRISSFDVHLYENAQLFLYIFFNQSVTGILLTLFDTFQNFSNSKRKHKSKYPAPKNK